MPDLTAAELSIPAEQHPDPAKPLVIPVDSTVVGSTLRFIPWSVVGNPAFLNLPPSGDATVGPDSAVGRHQCASPVQ